MQSRAHPRRASLSLELLLILPVLVALALAVIQFGLMESANQRLALASAQAARAAAQGGDLEDVERAARRVLGEGRLRHARVHARLSDESGRPLPSGETVEVVVEIPADEAAPNLLRFLGVSTRGRVLSGHTVMRKE
jgi:hypothetical protein